MNENEKRILTILNQSGPSTRKEIASACGISWAATVKLVSRLEGKGLIRCLGESETKTENGKTSLVYAVAEARPLAIGIDVEYSRTRIAVYSLAQEAFYSAEVPTEGVADAASLVSFLAGLVAACRERLSLQGLEVDGVGVGMPSWLVSSRKPIFDQVARALSEACGLPAVADNNTRAYTLYLQRKLALGGSFATFIVRRGVGIGITIGGELYRGEDGLAGELGHLTYDPSGPACRCGKKGCVETYFNQSALVAAWGARRSAAPGDGLPDRCATPDCLDSERETLHDLFTSAARGDPAAESTLSDLCRYLVLPVSALSLAMDIRKIVLAGHFGPDGGALARLLEARLKDELHPRFRHDVSYEALDDEGFLIGASTLFLSRYCDYRVLGSDGPKARQ